MNNMTNFLPMFAVLAARRDRRRRMFDAALPAFVPAGDAAQRAAMTVVVADQQVREAERSEARAARETITAVQRVAKNGTDRLRDTDLDGLPTLSGVIRRTPDIRQRIDQLSADQLDVQDLLADEAARVINAALDVDPNNADSRLTEAQTQSLAPNLIVLLRLRGCFPGDVFELPVAPPSSTLGAIGGISGGATPL